MICVCMGGGWHGKHIYWANLIGGSFAQILINLDAKEVQNKWTLKWKKFTERGQEEGKSCFLFLCQIEMGLKTAQPRPPQSTFASI